MDIMFVNLMNFIEGSHPRHAHPPMDIGYSATLLNRNGHNCKLVEIIKDSDKIGLFNHLKKNNIDLIVVKPTLETDFNFFRKLRAIEETCLLVVGPAVSTNPSMFVNESNYVDFGIVGEFEEKLVDIVRFLENNERDSIKKIGGICWWDKRRKKLFIKKSKITAKHSDMLISYNIFPDVYTFWYPIKMRKRVSPGFVLSSRGCPFDCIFCSPVTRVSYGKSYRVRDVKKVVDEIESLRKRGINFVYFLDDCFGVDKKYAKDLCKEIIRRKIKISWAVQTRVDCVDRNILKLMKEAGCTTLCFGIESGSDRVLSFLKKRTTVKKIRHYVNLAKKFGFIVTGFFIIGTPFETVEDINKSIKFAKELRLDAIQVHFFTPYPGSNSYETWGGDYFFGNKFSPYISLNFSYKSLEKLQKMFYRKFYISPDFVLRYIKNSLFYVLFNPEKELKRFFSFFKFVILENK